MPLSKSLPCLIALTFTLALSSQLRSQTVVDFEELPVTGAGFFNGDTNAGSPFRDNFTITGTRDNFGQEEFLQLWKSQRVDFFNSYTPGFDSFNGFAWSTVQDTTTAGFGNQFASLPGGGSNGAGGSNAGEAYSIAFGNQSYFNLPRRSMLQSVDLTNTTYAGISMRDGDSFAKKFGGDSGDDPDFFSVTFTGFSQTDLSGSEVGSLTFLLADFRFNDNALDYIVDDWTAFDLTGLGDSLSVSLTFETTDVSGGFANTPLYVAIDNLSFITAVPEPSGIVFGLGCGLAVVMRRRRGQNL